MDNIHPDEMP